MSAVASSSPTEDLVYNAKLAEQGERYDEMCVFMKEVATSRKSLAVEERNLLSVAYKNAVGSRRASWRIMSNVEQRKTSKGLVVHANLACEFRKRVEAELNTICEDILSLLDDELIPNASSPEFVVFYYKMKGDYCRYMAEFSQDGSRDASKDRAQEAYENATKIATSDLSSTDPVRLGLALNYSVFNYEILNDPTVACDMARKAFDDAIQELDSVAEESYRDSTLIMHLLRDNLTLWNPQDEQAAATGSVEGEKEDVTTKK